MPNFRSSPKTADLLVSFNKFTDSALNLYIIHVWNGIDAREHFAQVQEWNLQIKQRFESEQIEMAFPTQTIHLRAGLKIERGPAAGDFEGGQGGEGRASTYVIFGL